MTTIDCPYCESAGCSECDHTGQRVTTSFEVDGHTMIVHGSAPLSPESAAALVEVGRAIAKMNDHPITGGLLPTMCPRCAHPLGHVDTPARCPGCGAPTHMQILGQANESSRTQPPEEA